jgi:hypothetical protein
MDSISCGDLVSHCSNITAKTEHPFRVQQPPGGGDQPHRLVDDGCCAAGLRVKRRSRSSSRSSRMRLRRLSRRTCVLPSPSDAPISNPFCEHTDAEKNITKEGGRGRARERTGRESKRHIAASGARTLTHTFASRIIPCDCAHARHARVGTGEQVDTACVVVRMGVFCGTLLLQLPGA